MIGQAPVWLYACLFCTYVTEHESFVPEHTIPMPAHYMRPRFPAGVRLNATCTGSGLNGMYRGKKP